MPDLASLAKEPVRVRIAIDRGGTFTDCLGLSETRGNILIKLLSVDPANYADAPTEGIRRILEWFTGMPHPRGEEIDTSPIAWIRMGTTVATNALLERKGQKHAMLITKGFKDLIDIGNQTRPNLFQLAIKKPEVLYEKVVEVDERVIVQWPDLLPIDGSLPTPAGDDLVKGTSDLLPTDGSLRTPAGDELVKGTSGDFVRVVEPLDIAKVTSDLQSLCDEGYTSVGICLAHAYTFPAHEQAVASIARKIGFQHVSVSSELQAMIRFVSRANSASADAYLTPQVKTYLEGFSKGFKGHLKDGKTDVQFMKSDGSLIDYRRFSGLNAVLSGPAGGVVGYAQTSYDENDKRPVVGFDMGGTSTDVSRFANSSYEHVMETVTAGVTICAPQLDINTVAAGGGSILHWQNQMLRVGPDSASSHPGPACYRKGGPLAVTDANLFLGRLHVDSFPKIFGPTEDQPLDFDIVKQKFEALTAEINADTGGNLTPYEVASGFIEVANETMAKPIRQLTGQRGYLTTEHNLSCFGGAGGQHACAIAANLGIHNVIVHKYSSVLSAYGMALADTAVDKTEPSSLTYSESVIPIIGERLAALSQVALDDLVSQHVAEETIDYEQYLNMRYAGSDTSLMILKPASGDFKEGFLAAHQREFGFVLSADILIDDFRVRAIGRGGRGGAVESRSYVKDLHDVQKSTAKRSLAFATTQTYFSETEGHVETPIFRLESLKPGHVVAGPAIILDATQTLVIHPANSATILHDHVWIDVGLGERKPLSTEVVDPIALSVFGSRFMSIAERMGRTLQRTATSLQIKERLDFSCAVFSPDGGLVANAPHIPVHLGSMQYAITFAKDFYGDSLKDGDVIISNHPSAGGTHLPDITIIMPVFEDGEVVFFVAARGHHSDIGGLHGHSMPPDSVELPQEGAAFMPMLLLSGGVYQEEAIVEVFNKAGEYPECLATRRIQDNLADLRAQCAACSQGSSQIKELFQEYGKPVVQFYMRAIRNNAEDAVRNFLRETFDRFGGRPLHAIDYMDDGTPIEMTVTINRELGSAKVDFTGTGPESWSNYNAPPAVAYSALIYCFRTLIGVEMPLNAGVLAPLDVILPEGSLLKPSAYAAVSSGNTETSQRICDVIFRAFEAMAGSQGCMNVFHSSYGTMTYGETICGGAGAGPGWNGQSGVHINMTNTRITDPEILEKRFPLMLRRFEIRHGSGGKGKWTGGSGVHREFEFLCENMDCMIIGERRVNRPYGLHGGEGGERGCTYWDKQMPDGTRRVVKMKPSPVFKPRAGDRVILHTPGGGGYGAPEVAEEPAMNGVKHNGAAKANGAHATHYPRANGSVSAYLSLQEQN
ncbi:hypothetical protein Rhopal_007236-T1 [Rhodotorula paludigena]|uniref:5-oxoprolinase n=1 Tax=Rhodotorula paludigena TaxID=86838 RepID=A0AAV5GYR2_9BASI|nr:hypothetical protein Rhopal_007236-T1 [Rhodotorula paludigena]